MTERASTLSPRSRPGLVAVVLAVVVPVLLSAGTGNAFAAHMARGPDLADQRAAQTAVGPTQQPGPATATGAGGTVPHDAQSSHVLHLLGGCIAVLGAALLLVGAWSRSRARPHLSDPATAGAVVPGAGVRSWWRPPALSPPTTSPVLRN